MTHFFRRLFDFLRVMTEGRFFIIAGMAHETLLADDYHRTFRSFLRSTFIISHVRSDLAGTRIFRHFVTILIRLRHSSSHAE